jgi:hypothetical protein
VAKVCALPPYAQCPKATYWRPNVALILTLRKGDDLFVCDEAGDQQLIVEHILNSQHYVIRAGEALYDIIPEQAVEVLPNIRLFIGQKNGSPEGRARLAIEAPENVRIFSGKNYRKSMNAN